MVYSVPEGPLTLSRPGEGQNRILIFILIRFFAHRIVNMTSTVTIILRWRQHLGTGRPGNRATRSVFPRARSSEVISTSDVNRPLKQMNPEINSFNLKLLI